MICRILSFPVEGREPLLFDEPPLRGEGVYICEGAIPPVLPVVEVGGTFSRHIR
jgi:hypothetical protein